jgi:hypothetical protein
LCLSPLPQWHGHSSQMPGRRQYSVSLARCERVSDPPNVVIAFDRVEQGAVVAASRWRTWRRAGRPSPGGSKGDPAVCDAPRPPCRDNRFVGAAHRCAPVARQVRRIRRSSAERRIWTLARECSSHSQTTIVRHPSRATPHERRRRVSHSYRTYAAPSITRCAEHAPAVIRKCPTLPGCRIDPK